MRVRLQRIYKSTYTIQGQCNEANFYVSLECVVNDNGEQNGVFHMTVATMDRFLNGAINVCDWPVPKWTCEQIQECVRIFEDEYVPCCAYLSELVDERFLVERAVVGSEGSSHIQPEHTNEEIAQILWDTMQNSKKENGVCMDLWTQHLEDNRFGVCDSIHDCSYIEDPFPFRGGINAFGEVVPSYTELYKKYLPTLYALAVKSPQ